MTAYDLDHFHADRDLDEARDEMRTVHETEWVHDYNDETGLFANYWRCTCGVEGGRNYSPIHLRPSVEILARANHADGAR